MQRSPSAVLVYAPDPSRRVQINRLLSTIAFRSLPEWRTVLAHSGRSHCVVLDFPDLVEQRCREVLILKTVRPLLGTILLTDYRRTNLLKLAQLNVDIVLPADPLDPRLCDIVTQTLKAGPLAGLAQLVEASSTIHSELKAALLAILRADPPFRSVTRLASSLGIDRRRLATLWNQQAFVSKQLRLEDVIDIMILFHAARLRAEFSSWATCAFQLGVSRRTLTRTAGRLLNSRLSDLRDSAPHRLEQTLVAAIVHCLTGPIHHGAAPHAEIVKNIISDVAAQEIGSILLAGSPAQEI